MITLLPGNGAAISAGLMFVGIVGAIVPGFRPAASADEPASADNVAPDSSPEYRTESIHGQVVWLAEALDKQFGISTVPDVAEYCLAIRTPDGQLVPLVENLRGRAFRRDERLRAAEMEILVRRYELQPFVQVLRVYERRNGRRYEVDYWCDVCAIVMFEKGPCSCCQDQNRLRKRLVDEDGTTTDQEIDATDDP